MRVSQRMTPDEITRKEKDVAARQKMRSAAAKVEKPAKAVKPTFKERMGKVAGALKSAAGSAAELEAADAAGSAQLAQRASAMSAHRQTMQASAPGRAQELIAKKRI